MWPWHNNRLLVDNSKEYPSTNQLWVVSNRLWVVNNQLWVVNIVHSCKDQQVSLVHKAKVS
jgi:hypothetical protein